MGAGRLYCSPLLNKMAVRLYEKIIARVEMKRKDKHCGLMNMNI